MVFVWGKMNDPVYVHALALRVDVFFKEQNCEEVPDEWDPIAAHVVGYVEGVAAATARLIPEGKNTWRVGRFCTAKQWRGTGLGRLLMVEAEKKAAEMGATLLVLDGQCQAQGFYETLGYAVCGPVHLTDGIDHVAMDKKI